LHVPAIPVAVAAQLYGANGKERARAHADYADPEILPTTRESFPIPSVIPQSRASISLNYGGFIADQSPYHGKRGLN
jgi:hypothetical protein